jgi:DNA polymerase-3 subunit alpha
MENFTNCKVSSFNDLESYVNRELCFGGVVSDVQHRESKAGRGWAIFTVEDYEDSYDFKIFGEDYLKYRHLLTPNSFIFGRVFVKEGWVNRDTGKKGEPRLQYNQLQQLHDVMESFVKKLTLELPIEELKTDTIEQLKELISHHKGDRQLHFTLYEIKNKVKLNMPSRTKKINIDKELLQELEQLKVPYRLN